MRSILHITQKRTLSFRTRSRVLCGNGGEESAFSFRPCRPHQSARAYLRSFAGNACPPISMEGQSPDWRIARAFPAVAQACPGRSCGVFPRRRRGPESFCFLRSPANSRLAVWTSFAVSLVAQGLKTRGSSRSSPISAKSWSQTNCTVLILYE
jgi:hypothetical protein